MGAAGRYDVLFCSDRFNLSEPREYFINDCCFGDDVARWLADLLQSRGLTTTEPDQEDWGWYFDVCFAESRYFVGIGGAPDEEVSASNQGQWRLIVEKHRTLRQKLSGSNKLRDDDAFVGVLKDIVSCEPGLVLLGIE